MLRRATPLIILLPLFAAGCATRLSRPAYQGTVFDAQSRAPLPDVQVSAGEQLLTTDADGKFFLPALTYRELTFPGMEAPALLFRFSLHKSGYCPREIEYLDTRGGAAPPSQIWLAEIALAPAGKGPCPKQERAPPIKLRTP